MFLVFLLPVDYINCFDTCQCFALAFGVPAVLMVVSIGERGCVCMYICMLYVCMYVCTREVEVEEVCMGGVGGIHVPC